MAIATERLDQGVLRGAVLSLGFGSKSGLGIPGEEGGLVTSKKNWSHWTQTSVGMGYEVAVTPVQMVRAFSVFAREGEMAGTLPELRMTAAGGVVGGEGLAGMMGEEIVVRRVFDPEVAIRVRGPMEMVADRMDENVGRTIGMPEPKYRMFGKSGTAYIPCVPPKGKRRPVNGKGYFEKQYNSSFIAAAPSASPEIVVLVVIDDPGPAQIAQKRHYGSWVAGPVVRRITDRVLPYLGVMPEEEEGEEDDGEGMS